MSPVVVTILCLAALYVLGRRFEHHGHRTGVLLSPSRIEHFLPDEEYDTWVEIWEERFAEDELERLWELPPRSHA